MAGEGKQNRLSRRGFLGLAAGAAAAAALPRQLVALGEPAEDVDCCECAMCIKARQVIEDWKERVAYGVMIAPDGIAIPYWQVAADSVTYLGIERTAGPCKSTLKQKSNPSDSVYQPSKRNQIPFLPQ